MARELYELKTSGIIVKNPEKAGFFIDDGSYQTDLLDWPWYMFENREIELTIRELADQSPARELVEMRDIPLRQPSLIEKFAALEHEQWVEWSREIAKEECLSPGRVSRWQGLWVPYAMLSEDDKEFDRKWARKVLEVLGR